MDFVAKSFVKVAYCGIVKVVVVIMTDTNSVNVGKFIHSAWEGTVAFHSNHASYTTIVIENRISEDIKTIHLN